MMQKLLVIELKALADRINGEVREFITDYLEDGWRVVSVTAAGAGEDNYRSFLVVVVVERDDDESIGHSLSDREPYSMV
jgi:hypothetical protein